MNDYVTIQTRVRVTDDNLETLVETAQYGGISYWAVDASQDDKDTAFAADPDTLMVFRDGEENTLVAITRQQLREAFAKLAAPDQQIVGNMIFVYIQNAIADATEEDGLDMGCIDSDAADVWVQVAAFGKIVYG